MIGLNFMLVGIGILVISCIGIAVVRFRRLRILLNKEIIDYSVQAREEKRELIDEKR